MEVLIFLLLALSTQSLATYYEFVNQMKNWQSAMSYCRQHFADLATIEDADDWAKVNETLVEQNVPVWIGLHKSGGSWIWSEDKSSTYRVWAPGMPLNNGKTCTEASKTGWINRFCHISRTFICTVHSSRRIWKVAMKTARISEINYPEVEEAILRKVEKTMRNQTIQWQLEMTWRMHPNEKVFNWTQ